MAPDSQKGFVSCSEIEHEVRAHQLFRRTCACVFFDRIFNIILKHVSYTTPICLLKSRMNLPCSGLLVDWLTQIDLIQGRENMGTHFCSFRPPAMFASHFPPC